MTKFLIVHGAGMNMRGKAQIDIFGPMTLAQYDEHALPGETTLRTRRISARFRELIHKIPTGYPHNPFIL